MSERLLAIVEGMHIRPDDQVLEIGCGHGVAASFICERLRRGHLVAIDKSKKMIAAAFSGTKSMCGPGRQSSTS